MSITDELSTPPDKPLPSEPPNHAELIDTKTIFTNSTSEQNTDVSIHEEITTCTSEQSTDVSIHEEISFNDIDNSLQTNNSPSKSEA